MGFLSEISSSEKLKQLNIKELKQLSAEIREKIIETINGNGGHLSSNLGMVETTLALHYVFDMPQDKMVFDVGHQCYAHKLLSGRADKFDTIRTKGGLSGFTCKDESEYDSFTSGHAGTSIASALGLCMARDKTGEDYSVINVVGDGSLFNGLNMEAVTASQGKPRKLIVILNDNEMSISKNTNGFYKLISKGSMRGSYVKSKNAFKKVFRNSFVTKFFRKIRDFIKRIFTKNNYFENFGFKYIGVIDGNNLKEMIKVLKRVKTIAKDRAVFLHVKTTKGKGFEVAEEQADRYHGVGKNMNTGCCVFSSALGEKLTQLIEKDKNVVAITAGMKDGTGLSAVEKIYPKNVYDVGIAEEYAVTLAGGMATGGIKPFVCVYSTFLQRGYDEILHDVCLQNLPVVFCIDRAGLVGEDGQTHQGVFDLSYLTHLPNICVLAPSSSVELKQMLDFAYSAPYPVAIRYPNEKIENERECAPFISPCWEVVADGNQVAVLAVGPRMLRIACEVAKNSKYSVKVVNARSVKPLDENVLNEIKDMPIITLEENSAIGGFGSLVLKYYADNGVSVKTKVLGVKDEFICHGSVGEQLMENGLTEENLSAKIEEVIKGKEVVEL